MADSFGEQFIQARSGNTNIDDLIKNIGINQSRKSFSVSTQSNESFKKLVDRLSAVRRTTTGLKALKQKPQEKRPGLLETLFGQEKGIVTAPARFVTALAADVLDLPFQDEEAKSALEQYNPLEAAVRSAKGEFAITGGDFIKVNKEDDFLTRMAKYAGALAIDIGTDPTNFFGGISTFGRKATATMAVRDGEKMLPLLTSLASKGKVNPETLIDNLFESNRAVQAAKLGEKRYADMFFPGGKVDLAERTRVAGLQLGYLIGANFERYGRDGVRRGIAKLLGSDELATEFMQRLPMELGTETGEAITGGLFLKGPFSGRPIARVAGGKGQGNAVTNALNEVRFRATASAPVQFLSRNFSGRYGITWAEAKRGLIHGVDIKDIPKTSILDYVSFKDAMSQMNKDTTVFGNATNRFATLVTAARTASENPEEFDSHLMKYYHAPQLPLPVGASDIERDAYDTVQVIRGALNEARQAKIDAGIPVRDKGENWTLLRFTDEYYDELRQRGVIAGGEELKYQPGFGRTAETEYVPDAEIAAKLGYQSPTSTQTVHLSAPSINERLGLSEGGNKRYEDNVIKMALSYINEAHRAVTQKRLVTALERTGTMLVLPKTVQDALVASDTASFVSAIGKIAPKVAESAKKYNIKLTQDLEKILDDAEIAPVQEEVRQRISAAADEVYRRTADVDTALAEVKAAAELVDQVTPTEAQIRRALSEVADLDSKAVLDEMGRLRNNAKRRADRLADRIAQQERTYEYVAQKTGMPGPPEAELTDDMKQWMDIAAEADVDVRRSTERMYDELDTVEEISSDIAESRRFRENVIRDNASALYRAYADREAALSLQRTAKENLQRARVARGESMKALRNAQSETTLLRTGAIHGVVWQYVEKRQAWLEMQIRYRNVKVSELSDQERYLYEQAKAKAEGARRAMERVLAYSTRKTYKGAGEEYAKTVIQLAERLSVDQFKVAQVITNAEALDDFAKKLEQVPLKYRMEIIGDMVESYKAIRGSVTKDELDLLEKGERQVIGSVQRKGRAALLKRESIESEVQRAMFLEDEFMKLGAGNTNIRVSASMRDVWTSRGVRGVLEDIYKLHTEPNEFQKFINRIYDPAALVWRVSATVARGPAFILNNLVGGHANNYLGGVSVADHVRSANMLAEGLKVIRKVQQKNPNATASELMDAAEIALRKKFGNVTVRDKNLAELYVEFFERGGHFDTDTFFQNEALQKGGFEATLSTGLHGNVEPKFSTEPVGKTENFYRRFVNFMLTNPVQRSLSDASQSSEIYLRFAAFVSGYRRFGNLDSAMDLVHLLHFNYSDLSGAESWIRRFVPFYTWSRNNVPLWARAAFIQNAKVNRLFSAQEEFEKAFTADGQDAWLNDYMPEWLNVGNGFVSYFQVGGNHIGLFPKTPLNDVDKLFEIRYIGSVPFPYPRGSEVVQAFGPAVKTPIEWITNRNYQYGYEYESLGQKILKTLEQSIPYVGTGKKLASGVLGIGDRERRITNLIGMLAGTPYGLTTITEKTLSGAAYGRNIQLSQQLKQAAADAGIDYEWLREQLNKGMSLAALTGKIATGQGNVERVALQKKFESFTKKGNSANDKNYNQILRDIRNG